MTKTKNIKKWKKDILKIITEQTGCNIQHNECPCNTCFHTWIHEHLGDELGHNFWEIILVLRGDYTIEDIKNFREQECWDCKHGLYKNGKCQMHDTNNNNEEDD